jgi:hypothetical protein
VALIYLLHGQQATMITDTKKNAMMLIYGPTSFEILILHKLEIPFVLLIIVLVNYKPSLFFFIYLLPRLFIKVAYIYN